MSLKVRVYDWTAWGLVVICAVGWPTSVLWWAKDEPAAILSLSWAALAYSAFAAIIAVDIRKEQDES